MSLALQFCHWATEEATRVVRSWNWFWFQPADPVRLAPVRILTGLVLLYIYLAGLPTCLDALGPGGWIDAQAWQELKDTDAAFRWSLWSPISTSAGVVALYGVLLVASGCLTVGYATRTAAVIVWLGQLSYAHRAFPSAYGLDSIAAILTLYLMLGPSGQAWSLDAWRASRRSGSTRTPPCEGSVAANVALRCIQVHMCIVYLFAGLSKLQGATWWSGLATYYAVMSPEMWAFELPVQWVGRHPLLTQAVANVSVLFTLAFEISFAFLIWNNRLRPILLAFAVVLHVGIGLIMGLGAFGVIMLAGCSAFLSAEGLRYVGAIVSRHAVPPRMFAVSVGSRLTGTPR